MLSGYGYFFKLGSLSGLYLMRLKVLAKTKTSSPIGNTPSGENNSTRPLNSKIKANAGEKQLNSSVGTKQLNSTGENNSTRQHERNNSTGENNSTQQQERTTQLVSRNETTQLNRRKQLNSSVGTKQLNSALPSTAYNRLQPPTTTCNRLQPPTTAYNHLQPPSFCDNQCFTSFLLYFPFTERCNASTPPKLFGTSGFS
ncbi:hypothetical protein TNCV_399041 [Trichonephila clavipes]|uniref:Uncharacterized protein n=1 Tax=Trichonephila clavipes TaxID=2585209 RepID=A0A8X7B7R9_TRICX|nr:hypothetical protein TNCV_399041 [Trichonephila clavipes]